MPKILSHLTINKLELSVHLGVSEQERFTKQTVWIDLQLIFRKPSKACVTDNFDHTNCYQVIINLLQQEISDNHFALVEHLTFTIYNIIKKQLPRNTKVSVKLTKFPAIINLRDGVTFCYEDK